jgi:hypothetical protein
MLELQIYPRTEIFAVLNYFAPDHHAKTVLCLNKAYLGIENIVK